MLAAIYEGIDTIVVREAPKPAAEAGGALLRVRSCAVCGSDIRIFHHGNSRVVPPQVLGHEIAGEIVETGAGVTKFKVGDRVAVGADVPCGQCAFCEAGIGNNCQINYAMGYQFAGGFAEYTPLNATVINYGPVHILPQDVSYDEGALAEPLACVLNAFELSPVRLGDVVVVIGAGPIGMMICEVARAMGAAKVILVNRSAPRLEMAKSLGGAGNRRAAGESENSNAMYAVGVTKPGIADIYVNSSECDAVQAVLDETGGLGADVILTSNPSGAAQAQALQMAKNRARINFFGGLPKGTLVTLDTNVIHYKELTVTGAHGSMPVHHGKALAMIASGKIDIAKYVTHRFALADIAAAFATAEGHAGLRVVVNP